jgi:hypothetical protein
MTNPYKVGDKVIIESGMSKKLVGLTGTVMYVDGEFLEVELEGRKDYDRVHYLALGRPERVDYTTHTYTVDVRDREVLKLMDIKVEDSFFNGLNEPMKVYEPTLPTKAEDRKATPVYSGVLKYFPDAIREIAKCSLAGNKQHNPDKPLHWDRSKSGDELDALSRHLLDAGTIDDDGIRHSAKVAWRALANLQKEIERDK